MYTLEDSAKINIFIRAVTPLVINLVEAILKSTKRQIVCKGQGLDTLFSIKLDGKEIVFCLHNLFLEVATIDRDHTPLRFDEQLKDFGYFIGKVNHLAESKLNILFQLLDHEDIGKAIKNIEQNSSRYERIRIVKFDKEPPK